MDSDLQEIKRQAYASVDRQYLPAQLDTAIEAIHYWQNKQKGYWASKDPRRAAICGEIITLYQREARQLNVRMRSWH